MTDAPAAGCPAGLWIDATRPAAAWHLWGMSLVERLLRQAAHRGVRRAEVCIAPVAAAAARLRPDFHRRFDMEVQVTEVAHTSAAWQRLTRPTPAFDPAGSLLVLDGDVVHDDRVLDHLLAAAPPAVVKDGDLVAAHWPVADLPTLAAAGRLAAAGHDGHALAPADLGDYVPELRLVMPPIMARLTEPAQLRRLDHLLYHRTFKGVIDAVARYGYYRPVRGLTRWLSRTSVSPNLLTVLSILGIWAAVPLFALGHLGWGVACAWTGVLLDSADGKLARLTVNLSDTMGAIEHATAMPGLGLWFVALTWHWTGGRLVSPSPEALAGAVLVVTFLADKVLTGAFKARFGFELFDARSIDARFHLVAARRNIHLLILTIGIVLNAEDLAFASMAAAMAVTFVVHAVRFAWIASGRGDRDGDRG